MYLVKKTIKHLFFSLFLAMALVVFQPSHSFASEKPIVIDLGPIIVPIITAEGISQIVTIVAAIEVLNSDGKDMVNRNRIRLMDAFLTDMYGVMDKNRLIRNGYVDIDQVKYRMNRITKRILGEDITAEILLHAVQQRKV